MHHLAEKLSEEVLAGSEVLVVTHIDADGIAAGSIACCSLFRAGIDCDISFVKSLDEETAREILDKNPAFVWFTDIGAGSYELISEVSGIITDHHVPSEFFLGNRRGRLASEFGTRGPSMLNPHLYGLDGSLDISGAGTSFLVAREMSTDNCSLSGLAVVGAVGDMQDQSHRRLIGSNRKILHEAVSGGWIERSIDIRFFGRETRPVPRLLAYSNDPSLPGLTGDRGSCTEFLDELGIALVKDDKWRCWSDLETSEKRQIVSALVSLLLESGFNHRHVQRMVGECYSLVGEERGSVLRDAKEFATLLNSCGRYGKADVGMRICLGDRDKSLEEALGLLRNHREYLVESLEIAEEMGIIEMTHLQYFHGGNRIKDTVIGVATGILLSSPEVNKSRPLFAFARTEECVKVSARATKDLVSRGLDLSIVMKEAAHTIGGVGGGHNIAAGATIPLNREEEFLELAERIIKDQMKSRGGSDSPSPSHAKK
ncbi:MAG: DHHA1 domain-containing protein [Thermoplasmata archaeon]